MGAGKTTLGRQLAKMLGRHFYDSDHYICERTGVSIPTIFELEGESGFRQRETAALEELSQESGIILATGGGAVTQAINREILKTRGTVIYLHASPTILLQRTQHDSNRPLLQVANPLAALEALYQIRDPLYRETAHLIIEAGNNQPCQHTAQLIIEQLQSSTH